MLNMRIGIIMIGMLCAVCKCCASCANAARRRHRRRCAINHIHDSLIWECVVVVRCLISATLALHSQLQQKLRGAFADSEYIKQYTT